MRGGSRTGILVAAVAVSLWAMPTAASAHPEQHGGPDGHLEGTGDYGKIDLVGQVEVTQTAELVADVAAFGNYAYLANWGEADCAGPAEKGGVNSPDAGAWVIDISDPSNPREVNFIPMPQDTRPGEGMQVLRIETDRFSGDMLVMNAEACGRNYKGGFMLYDVSDPLTPVKLAEGWGERTTFDTHQAHSAFVWQPPGSTSAYLVLQDLEDLADVDIFDITNPRRPRMIVELDLDTFNVAQPAINREVSFLHDITVKCMATGGYAGKCIMIASYWDGGYVLLDVTNPANPQVLFDTELQAVDPELADPANPAVPASSRTLAPEGNAHQAEFTADNRFFIGTDEDFDPYGFRLTTDDGGVHDFGEFPWTVPIEDPTEVNGPTVFGGYACPADRGAIPPADTVTLAPGEEAILVVQRGPLDDPSAPGEVCLFSEKVETGQLLGYDLVVVANHHTGALGGLGPDAHLCGSMGHEFDVQISGLCVGHRAMHELFDDPNAADNFTYPESYPTVGTVGDTVTLTNLFDGWGYVHLFDAATGQDLDTFAIPEAMDPAFAEGFGDLTVHEVATDPTDPSLAYLSYYAGGLRAIQIQCSNPAVTTTCELVEVGGFLDHEGNNFWGVEVVKNPADDPTVTGDEVLILASDRDYGLFIFRNP
jgi:hypothetical protein